MPDLTGIGSIFEFGTEAIKRIWPDASDAERAKQTLLLAELDAAHRERLAQIDTNTAQAANPSLFVSGPRPALMWICVIAFGLQYIGYPTWIWIAIFDGDARPARPAGQRCAVGVDLWHVGAGRLAKLGEVQGRGAAMTRRDRWLLLLMLAASLAVNIVLVVVFV